MAEPLRILSMGWGVQTWTLASMIALGEMEPVDFMVFADTDHETEGTYAFSQQWTPWLRERGCEVVTVGGGRTDVVDYDETSNRVMIPAFTVSPKGKLGQVRRVCTSDWKIGPIRRFISQQLEERGQKKSAGAVVSLMGISWDESLRMKDSDVAYVVNEFPLIDRRMTRFDCKSWLDAHDLPEPPKSACTFCPYHSKPVWQEMKRQGGQDWKEAVAVDANIRDRRGEHGQSFVHSARLPLEEAVAIPEDVGAMQLTLDDACEGGFCFV